jgi:branched-chain amino acid transport system permease protein
VAPEALRMLLFGLSMIGVMLYRPEGMWPAPKHGARRRAGKDGSGDAKIGSVR